MHVRPLRSLAVVATSLALAVSAVPADAAPEAGPRNHTKAKLAASWQGSQLTKGVIHNGQYDFDDWGLTVDTALALAAVGNEPKKLKHVTRVFAKNYFKSYVRPGGDFYAGAAAKTLLAVDVLNRSPRHFGGHNVRALVLNLVAPDTEGFETGRVRDQSQYPDTSSTFAQSYAVIGLARTGRVPQDTVNYLKKQQCPEGYFRLTEVAGENCATSNSKPDVDATALAIQALLAADKAGAEVPVRAVSKAAKWLVSAQHDNGSFPGGTSTPGPNTNSTGLAAQALRATGHDRAQRAAASYVASMQLTAANATGAATKDIGAIAYNKKALKNALKNGIQLVERDQFRRATAQAIFAFAPIPLTKLTAP
jgi:hypothetical protein